VLAGEKISVIMSHDVDWPLRGPSRQHILQRKDRYDDAVIKRVIEDNNYNPYFGVRDIMEIEDKYGIRSTFFFRPLYDDGSSVEEYRETIEKLLSAGWEVGVHINEADLLSSIEREKRALEKVANRSMLGSRVHYLKIRQDDLFLLEKAGIKYDSSVCFSKDKIDRRNTGFFAVGNLIVFPITIMDTYLFTYMHVPEEHVVDKVKDAIELAGHGGIATLLWHDNSVNMKGGRMFKSVVDYLAGRDDVEVLRGIDAYEMVSNGQRLRADTPGR
jgi:peptidoglycan/xylan/chitin deacetylase (PgdA/CDA1 family)